MIQLQLPLQLLPVDPALANAKVGQKKVRRRVLASSLKL
eukprot:COSAG02_NODE_29486_length_568_cov_0.963753_1_plen_38_part_10